MTGAKRGFTKVPNEILEDSTITLPARMLYIILLSKAWTKNQVFPGQKHLAAKMGINDRSVRKYLSELVGNGLIVRQRRGLTKTNIYTLNKWIPSSHQQKNIPIKNEDNFPPQNGTEIPTNNIQNKKNKSESDSPSIFSLSSEDLQMLANRCEVKTSAIEDAFEKYHLYCEDRDRRQTMAGFKLWILRENWEIDDYNFKKRNELEMQALMRSF
jgi:hypothetical protein